MATAVKVEVIGEERVIAKFDGYVVNLKPKLTRAMNIIVFTLVRYVQENKLSGQVLKRRTGTLSRSIKGVVNELGGSIVGDVASRDRGNAPLKYAAYHEYGFQGQQNVRAHIRRLAGGGTANVRDFIRNVNYPAHAFMRPSRDENLGFIKKTLEAAVNEANK